MADGRIVESGTHEQFLAMNGQIWGRVALTPSPYSTLKRIIGYS
jgi:hypothetical protein